MWSHMIINVVFLVKFVFRSFFRLIVLCSKRKLFQHKLAEKAYLT